MNLLRLLSWTPAVACLICGPAAGSGDPPAAVAPPAEPWPPGMVWVPGGEFVMGTDDAAAPNNEKPAHRAAVDGFWVDVAEVTNAEFNAFVEATDYTTVAERPVDWEELRKQVPPGTPKPPDEMLQPGSLVFVPPDSPTNTADFGAWWRWMTGANWRHPEGPASSLDGRWNHPVVHIAYEDALAYAAWAGKRLPTEAEWECAARGGLSRKRFTWGDEEVQDDQPRCNIWQGEFPSRNTLQDGYLRTAPVGSFAPNAYGVHDMAGNVWEWCTDLYRADAYERRLAEGDDDAVAVDPTGPVDCWDPNDAVPASTKHVIRGGSFLCHQSYCESYRPSARRGESPDTGTSHLGFRCVMSDAQWRRGLEGVSSTAEDSE